MRNLELQLKAKIENMKTASDLQQFPRQQEGGGTSDLFKQTFDKIVSNKPARRSAAADASSGGGQFGG